MQTIRQVRHDACNELLGLQMLLCGKRTSAEIRDTCIQIVKRLKELLGDLKTDMLSTPHTCEQFYALLRTKAEEAITRRHDQCDVHVEFDSFPEELATCLVVASASKWTSVIQNLINNAVRKEARTIRVSLARTSMDDEEMPAVLISVRDDGLGMNPDVLAEVRAGKQVTDKCVGDGFDEEDQREEHGVGLVAVREFIEGRCGGHMSVDSLQGDKHGTEFTFQLPAVDCAESDEECEEDDEDENDEPVSDRRRITRRVAIGTMAATAGSALAWYCIPRGEGEGEASKPVSSPVKEVAFDNRGGIESFVLELNGEPFEYRRGCDNPAFEAVRELPLQNGSIVMLTPASRKQAQFRKMYLCGVPEGMFGYVDVPQGEMLLRGFVCASRDSSSFAMHIPDDRLFLLKDTLFDGRFTGTNAALLQSRDLKTMQRSLEGVREEVHAMPRAESARMVAPLLQNLLSYRNLCERDGMHVSTPEEWQNRCGENGRFIIAEPPVVEHLRQNPVTQRQSSALRQQGHTVCLVDVFPDEAQRIIHT